MSSTSENDDVYEPDTPEAILRCAVAVACCDGQFAHDEQDRVRAVYADICREMTFSYDRLDISDEYQEIAEDTSQSVLSLTDDEKYSFIEECGELITDTDLREMTILMALRIAGGDSDLDQAEFRALKCLADMWQIRLSDVVEPYID